MQVVYVTSSLCAGEPRPSVLTSKQACPPQHIHMELHRLARGMRVMTHHRGRDGPSIRRRRRMWAGRPSSGIRASRCVFGRHPHLSRCAAWARAGARGGIIGGSAASARQITRLRHLCRLCLRSSRLKLPIPKHSQRKLQDCCLHWVLRPLPHRWGHPAPYQGRPSRLRTAAGVASLSLHPIRAAS